MRKKLRLKRFFILVLIAAVVAIVFRYYRGREGLHVPPEKAVVQIFSSQSCPTPNKCLNMPMRFAPPGGNLPRSRRSREAIARVQPGLEADLAGRGLRWGVAIYIQIFKSERKLLIHVYDETRGYFVPWKQYRIVSVSGTIGPKMREGDRQGPEGFYYTSAAKLNPNSKYHLSFDVGYPNAYDRSRKRTGSWIMIHGSNKSIGCFAMGDEAIEEIYAMVDAALKMSQRIVRIHIFPFRMSEANLERYKGHRWESFWRNLREGYDFFETYRLPPNVDVRNQRYQFNCNW